MSVNPVELLPYQQRVVEEQKEPSTKIDRLSEFLESALREELKPLDHQLMLRQLECMQHYDRTLVLRIKSFTA